MKAVTPSQAARRRVLLSVCALILAALACDLPASSPAPTPAANQVIFTEVYTSYLHEGEALPGSNVRYVSQEEGAFVLMMGETRTVKKTLDSLNWKGQVAPGVTLDYKLRILGVVLDQFEATGPLEIVVDGVTPVPGSVPESADYHFDGLVISSVAKKGYTIAGTAIGYAGKDDQGALLTGVDGEPHRQVLDSVDWSGQLRPNVWLKATLRVTAFDEKQLSMAGTGEIWINTK